MAFQGEHHNSIDAKGRASIPAEFRKALQGAYGDEQLVVTKNMEKGLTAYPLSVWKEISEKVQQSPNSKHKKSMLRVMIAPSKVVAFDAQGRIPLPAPLRDHAGLEKDLVVVGVEDKIEIYSRSRHAAVVEQSIEVLDENPEFLDEMGF